MLNDDLLINALLTSMVKLQAQLTGRRIWLALSGGRDSLTLATVCLNLYHKGHLPFCPQFIHINHGMQTANDAWALQVQAWAKENNCQCVIIKTQVDGTDEQAARHARYLAIANHLNCHDVLMTAHHANDQSETLLMRLFSGTGVKGLSGMADWSSHDIAINTTTNKTIHLWRPWLYVSRNAISKYAKRHALPYIDDPTNITGTNVRSWLRRDLLPIIEKRYSHAIGNIARLSTLMNDTNTILQEVYQHDKMKMIDDCYIQAQKTNLYHNEYNAQNEYFIVNSQLDLTAFLSLSTARQRSLLYHWLHEQDSLTPNKQRIDDILALACRDDNDHQTQLHWQGNAQHYVIKRYRHTLHRLHVSWLNWLQTPMICSNFIVNLADEYVTTSKANIAKPHITVTLRKAMFAPTGQQLTWQLTLNLNTLKKHMLQQKMATKAIKISIRPLHKDDRISISSATKKNTRRPPQSGKKLQQSLGIASWLRQSVLLIEAHMIEDKIKTKCPDQTLPLLLICPWQQWTLQAFLANVDNTNNEDGIFMEQAFILSSMPPMC